VRDFAAWHNKRIARPVTTNKLSRHTFTRTAPTHPPKHEHYAYTGKAANAERRHVAAGAAPNARPCRSTVTGEGRGAEYVPPARTFSVISHPPTLAAPSTSRRAPAPEYRRLRCGPRRVRRGPTVGPHARPSLTARPEYRPRGLRAPEYRRPPQGRPARRRARSPWSLPPRGAQGANSPVGPPTTHPWKASGGPLRCGAGRPPRAAPFRGLRCARVEKNGGNSTQGGAAPAVCNAYGAPFQPVLRSPRFFAPGHTETPLHYAQSQASTPPLRAPRSPWLLYSRFLFSLLCTLAQSSVLVLNNDQASQTSGGASPFRCSGPIPTLRQAPLTHRGPAYASGSYWSCPPV